MTFNQRETMAFNQIECLGKNDVVLFVCIYIYIIRPGLSRVYPGRPGSGSTHRVDRVSPGQFPGCFLLRPGPAPDPGRPGPGSTHRAGPGFKTMLLRQFIAMVESTFH
jgi:hypothetical protein